MIADTEVKPDLPMDFADALRSMRKGGIMGRIAWSKNSVFEKVIGIQDGRIVKYFEGSNIRKGWVPSQADIFAIDWLTVAKP